MPTESFRLSSSLVTAISNVGQLDEGWCRRVPDQAFSGPGPLGCRSGRTRARKIQAGDHKAASELRAKFDALTHREKEVMERVTGGLPNKQIAGELGVTEITIKVHRGNVMRKLGAKSLADLVRMADTLAIPRRK